MTPSKYITILFSFLLFSCGNNPTDITKANTHYTEKPIDPVRKITNQQNIDLDLLSSWTHFKEVVTNKNYKEFKNISLNELHTCDTSFLVQKFLDKCFREIFDKPLLQKFTDTLYSDYVDSQMELGYFSQSALKQIDTKDSIITLRQFQIIMELTPDGAWTMTFDFVKTKNGYKFFGCGSFGGPICCR
jgi:hypothetical protein